MMGRTPVTSVHWLLWGKEPVAGVGAPQPCSSEGGDISHLLLASQGPTGVPHLPIATISPRVASSLHGHPSCRGGPLHPMAIVPHPYPSSPVMATTPQASCHPSFPLVISSHSHPSSHRINTRWKRPLRS